jgi:hypothetical protein
LLEIADQAVSVNRRLLRGDVIEPSRCPDVPFKINRKPSAGIMALWKCHPSN